LKVVGAKFWAERLSGRSRELIYVKIRWTKSGTPIFCVIPVSVFPFLLKTEQEKPGKNVSTEHYYLLQLKHKT
jgi:hypothetical protein